MAKELLPLLPVRSTRLQKLHPVPADPMFDGYGFSAPWGSLGLRVNDTNVYRDPNQYAGLLEQEQHQTWTTGVPAGN